MPRLSVALGLWPDRPPEEALETARVADQLRYSRLWIGERETWDVVALATAIVLITDSIPLTMGPVPVAVRDPAMLVRAAGSVSHLGSGRPVSIAIGAGSPLMVTHWHGREHRKAATALREAAQVLREFEESGSATFEGEVIRTRGYRPRLPRPARTTPLPVTVAAFGPGTLRSAAAHADRVVFALITAETAADLVERVRQEAVAVRGPKVPSCAVWVPAALTEGPDVPAQAGRAAVAQVRRLVAGYLAAPGYAQMFRREGFGDLVEFAQSRPGFNAVHDAVPLELVERIGIFGDQQAVRDKLQTYAVTCPDMEVVVLPCSTDEDPAGERTLRALCEIQAT
ncbi:LLM class F420-dependent oxidoreductase [Streptomyces sp. 205]|uniref:LLM class F420-dependent oxidoreductase n=2 Tax=Streptomyces coffeae TaxID=621382 RepID=A0ABS1NLM0_9ACTN|nr:LLM class F420-dependent oxidoreductase [Streptomyces coffeae]